jgi:hypothetical protein
MAKYLSSIEQKNLNHVALRINSTEASSLFLRVEIYRGIGTKAWTAPMHIRPFILLIYFKLQKAQRLSRQHKRVDHGEPIKKITKSRSEIPRHETPNISYGIRNLNQDSIGVSRNVSTSSYLLQHPPIAPNVVGPCDSPAATSSFCAFRHEHPTLQCTDVSSIVEQKVKLFRLKYASTICQFPIVPIVESGRGTCSYVPSTPKNTVSGY